jgi:hypothetical protein
VLAAIFSFDRVSGFDPLRFVIIAGVAQAWQIGLARYPRRPRSYLFRAGIVKIVPFITKIFEKFAQPRAFRRVDSSNVSSRVELTMSMLKTVAALSLAGAISAASGPASAAPLSSLSALAKPAENTAQVRWGGGWHGGGWHGGGWHGGGWGLGAGLLAGGLIAGALAAPYYYGGGYDPYYSYGYAYPAYGYGDSIYGGGYGYPPASRYPYRRHFYVAPYGVPY